jgi:DNA invertase Pin-like site-specific DNA recombinase
MRFADRSEGASLLAGLKGSNVSSHMMDLGGDRTGNGIFKVVFTILATVAEAIRDHIRERVMQGREDYARASTAPAPRLHPNLAEMHRQRIAALADVLETDSAMQVREVVRGSIQEIGLVPEDGRLRAEVRGEMAAILQLA